MKHRTDTREKLSRALQLHEQGVPSFAIGERLGISSKEAARTIHQAKERRTKQLIATALPSTECGGK